MNNYLIGSIVILLLCFYVHSATVEKEFLYKDNQISSLQKETNKRSDNSLLRKNTSLVSRGSNSGWTAFRATWYNAGINSTGKSKGQLGYGITSSGREVQRFVTAAVDPSVIPMGSYFVVKYPDGGYQIRRADDTGGAIKGHLVDLYTDLSDQEIQELGTSRVLIKMID